MTIRRSVTHLLFLLAIAGHAHPADRQLPGRVLRVIDGDSLILDVRGSQYQVELAGIDAPELNQPWGQTAADWLHQSLTGRFVVVKWTGIANDGRIEGRLVSRSRDIALDLLYAGLAWCTPDVATGSPDQDSPCREAEAAAREARRGLWSDGHPVPPWEWRKQGPRSFN